MKFEMDKDQVVRFKKWAEKQVLKTGRRSDSFGFRFQFLFGPTMDGCNVEVIDAFTGDKLDLTKDDGDNFIFNEDGTEVK